MDREENRWILKRQYTKKQGQMKDRVLIKKDYFNLLLFEFLQECIRVLLASIFSF